MRPRAGQGRAHYLSRRMTAPASTAAPPPAPPRVAAAAARDPRLPWIVALACVLPFLGWWSYGLFDLDEGFYAAIVGEMIRRHEWITPYYNGAPWYEKPILIYWAALPFVKWLGPTVGPRVSAILATWGTMALAAWFARRRLAAGTALIAPLVLATSLLVVAVGRMMLTDPLLVLCLSAGLVWLWESLVGDPRWRWAAGAAIGFGVLAKGPVAIAFFVLIAGITWWREPALRPRFRGGWSIASLLCLGVLSTWYWPIYLANRDDFVRGFLWDQNVGRFLGGDTAHNVPWHGYLIFYLPVLLVGMMPWSLSLARVWPRRTRPIDGADAARRFLQTWALTVFVFFTASGSKLVHYMLPAMIPLALLVADDCARRWAPLSLARLARPLLGVLGMTAFAQFGFTAYYGGLSIGDRTLIPGFHAELHRVAGEVARRVGPDDVILEYQTGRQRRPLPRTSPPVIETSHPTLRFYLDRVIPVTDSLSRVLAEPKRTWIITRWNRIDTTDVALAGGAGRSLQRVPLPFSLRYYALWTLTPRETAP